MLLHPLLLSHVLALTPVFRFTEFIYTPLWNSITRRHALADAIQCSLLVSVCYQCLSGGGSEGIILCIQIDVKNLWVTRVGGGRSTSQGTDGLIGGQRAHRVFENWAGALSNF